MRIAVYYIIREAHNYDLSAAGVRLRAEISDKEHCSTDENEIVRQRKNLVFLFSYPISGGSLVAC